MPLTPRRSPLRRALRHFKAVQEPPPKPTYGGSTHPAWRPCSPWVQSCNQYKNHAHSPFVNRERRSIGRSHDSVICKK